MIWPCLQIFNGLLQLDEKLNVIPCIASSWEISDNGLTYTFHLRNDVWFHKDACFANRDSTRKVTASDFEFSLNRLAEPLTASPGAWVMKKVLHDASGKLTGIKAIDDSTLRIRLSETFPPLPGLLTMPYCSVIPFESLEKYGPDFRSHPVGTGPFKFSFWKEGVKLILLKNENYFEEENGRKLPYLDAIDISFISDKQSAFIEFLKGKLDFLSGIEGSYKDDLLTHSGLLQEKYTHRFIMDTEPYLNTEYLGILMDSRDSSFHPLQQKKIRQALSLGFDRKKMIAYLRNNIGTPGIYGIVPPGLPSFNGDTAVYEYDPLAARRLLSEAGYPNGSGLPAITLSTTNNYLYLCEFIKSQWEELGFRIKIDVNQAAVHRKMIAEQRLEFFRGSWIADYPDAENYLSLFYSGNFAPGGPNYTHFQNKNFDTLFEKANSETNDSIRYRQYVELDRMMMEEAPVIILYYDKVLRIYRKNVLGLRSNAMNLLVLKTVSLAKQD